MLCVAKHTFNAQRENDLSFVAGDVILVEKARESGWWIGSLRGKKGFFPRNYVEVKDDSVC